MNYEDLSIRQKIDYKWKKYIEINGITYIKCPEHDFSPATTYGFYKLVECTECLKLRVKLYSEENKIER